MFRVTMQFGGKPVRKFTFDKELISIGRDTSCDIVIENIGASRRHATIEKTADGYVLADLKSHNGTFVEGEKIFHHRLSEADEFYIGKYCFAFEALEPVVELDDGVEEAQAKAPAAPDMTFRLDKRDIERIMSHSARGSKTQLVQIAPEGEKGTFLIEKAYVTLGKGETADVALKGFLVPALAGVVIRGDHGFRLVASSSRLKVNGAHKVDSPLTDGDLIQFGSRRYRFCQG